MAMPSSHHCHEGQHPELRLAPLDSVIISNSWLVASPQPKTAATASPTSAAAFSITVAAFPQETSEEFGARRSWLESF